MPAIDIPADKDPLMWIWTVPAPAISSAAGGYSHAVYERSTLPLREFEAARTAIAAVNDCNLCLNWRSADEVVRRADEAGSVSEEFYAAVREQRWDELDERSALAAEFANRFALDHQGMDQEFWTRLRASYTDAELVELGLCVASWLALGRFNRVFDVDGGCRIPAGLGTAAVALPI